MEHVQKQMLIPMDKYKRLLTQQSTPTPTPAPAAVLDTSSVIEQQMEEPLDTTLILSVLPKQRRQRGAALLKHIQNDPDQRLTWNPKGQVIYKGQLIQGSHIADLLKDSQYLYKRLHQKEKVNSIRLLKN